jgi:hypothetical protein
MNSASLEKEANYDISRRNKLCTVLFMDPCNIKYKHRHKLTTMCKCKLNRDLNMGIPWIYVLIR